jgi:hypothetical protein
MLLRASSVLVVGENDCLSMMKLMLKLLQLKHARKGEVLMQIENRKQPRYVVLTLSACTRRMSAVEPVAELIRFDVPQLHGEACQRCVSSS